MKEDPHAGQMVTPEEAAEILGVTIEEMASWQKCGGGPPWREWDPVKVPYVRSRACLAVKRDGRGGAGRRLTFLAVSA